MILTYPPTRPNRCAALALLAFLSAAALFPAHLVAGDVKNPTDRKLLDATGADTRNVPEMAYSNAVSLAKAGKLGEILEVARQGQRFPDLYLRTNDGKISHSVLPTGQLDASFLASGMVVRADNIIAESSIFDEFVNALIIGMSVVMPIVLFTLTQRWLASSRHRFGFYKWSLCRLMG